MNKVATQLYLLLVLFLCTKGVDIRPILNDWGIDEAVQTIECSVLSYGAVGNGRTDDTTAIRSAFESCGKNQTDAVAVIIFPTSYTFLTGAFNISTKQIVWVEENAKILAYKGEDNFHYPLVAALPSFPISTKKNSSPRYQGFISSSNAEMIGISGGGTIDGQGRFWWEKYDKGTLNYTRPRLVEIQYSSKISLSSVSFENSAFWTIHIYSSNLANISKVFIHNPIIAPNCDGIDIDSSKNVTITNCNIVTSDDHISMKSGEGVEGFQYNISTEFVLVENSYFGIGAGLSIGSETAAGIHHIHYRNNTLNLSVNAVRFKTCPNYGYAVSEVLYENIVFDGGIAVFVSEDYECSSTSPAMPSGGYHNVTVSNMTGSAAEAGHISCFAGGCTNFLFENITLDSLLGFRCENVTGECFNVSPRCCF